MSGRDTSMARVTLFILYGPMLWALHLLVAYGGHAALCAAGERLPLLDAGHLPLLLGGITIVVLAALVGGLLSPGLVARLLGLDSADDHTGGFLRRTMRLLTALSATGVVLAGAAMLVVPLCTTLR